MSLGLLAYRAAWEGFYPLIFVNYHPIYGEEIDRDLSVSYEYYHNALTYSGIDPGKLDIPDSYNELKRAVIDDAITREIIFRKLSSIADSGDINEVSRRNIENVLAKKPGIEVGVEKLYGLSLAKFKEQILLPQAYREILEGRMNLDNQNFNSWLKKARSESRVVILSPGFGWDGERVVAK